MRTIKIFKGNTPPTLKLGEWASDNDYAYLGMEHGQYKVFQGVFDMAESQNIAGFRYDTEQKAIIVPSATPFSKLQKLFDSLPKALKYSSNAQASIDILFEDGTYINDLGTNLVLRDFSYQINLKALSVKEDSKVATYEKPVVFQSDKAISIYSSAINFANIRFEYEDEQQGAIAYLNSSTYINDCAFESKKGGVCVSDKGYNRIVFSDCYFRMFEDKRDSILNKASVGSMINLARCKSDEDKSPKSVALWLYGGIIIVGNVASLHLGDKSQYDPTFGGMEIHNGFVTDVNGNVDVDIPKKLSDLENDLGLTKDYQKLDNKPTTITEEQATAIAENTNKKSYPNADKTKLSEIEEKATNGADWRATEDKPGYIKNKPTIPSKLSDLENDKGFTKDYQKLDNKPTTITEEQATAIAENTNKKSYPNADKTKLSEIEVNATNGANWSASEDKPGYIKNKPTIPTKLSELENDKGFTKDYEQLENKPTIPTKLSDLENDLAIKKLADFDPNDDQMPATCKAIANWNTGSAELTSSRIDWQGKPILYLELMADKTLSFSNLVANKKITIVAKGDFTLSFPSYCKELVSSSGYEGGKSNLIELVCTNDDHYKKEVWYNITPEL